MNQLKIGVLININQKHKTIKVLTEKKFQDKKYKKTLLKNKTYLAHFHSLFNCSEGDIVIIKKSKPISKTKHWLLYGVISPKFLTLLKKII
jgi:small subunit ribosomal protein S17